MLTYIQKIKLNFVQQSDLYLSIPNHVNITSASGGTLSLVNPHLKVYKIKQLSLIYQILHYLHLVEILIIPRLNLIFIEILIVYTSLRELENKIF